VTEEPYLKALVEEIPEIVEDTIEVKALTRTALELFQRLVSLVSNLPEELVTAALNIDDPLHLVYLLASNLRMDPEERQALLELDSVRDKLLRLNAFMSRELDLLELGKKIQSEVQEEVARSQREFYLREQLKAIQRELGETSEQEAEINEFRAKIEQSGMPEEARREALRELERMSKLPPASAEYGVIRTYLDWLVSLPWNRSTEGEIDIARARQILDEDHYDLEKIKERILEYLAVRRLRKERGEENEPGREPILLLRGSTRSRKDQPGAVDRPSTRTGVHADVVGWCARRGRDPWPPPHLYRCDAGPHHSGDPACWYERSGLCAGRNR